VIDTGGRKELFRVLTGSHNYNMNTPESDKDYKIFVLPTFDDLYHGKEFSTSHVGESFDYDVHDIRKVSHLWWKANINFVEVLFTEELHINPSLKSKTLDAISVIFKHRSAIARMNLPYLYDACIGMHITKKHQIDKGTAGTQYLVDKFGYDTKQAMHSLRVLDFLARFADGKFNDFKKAIWYEDGEFEKQGLLDIKGGKLNRKSYLNIAENSLSETKERYKELYKFQKPNEETREHLLRIVKDMVREELG
jgi:predicted nucleotidyltransferase